MTTLWDVKDWKRNRIKSEVKGIRNRDTGRMETELVVLDNILYLTGDFDGKKSRNVGKIHNGKFIKKVNPKSEFYILGRGYNISQKVLNWLHTHGIEDIIIVEKGILGTKHYATTVHDYMNGDVVEHENNDKQRSIPLLKLRRVK